MVEKAEKLWRPHRHYARHLSLRREKIYTIMPNTKESQIRELIIDRCLSSGKPMTRREITTKVNQELISRGVPPVNSKSTILDDFDNISQRWRVEIDKKRKGNLWYYNYKDPSFSIFKQTLLPSELEKLYQIVNLIKDFTGLPQFEWLEQVRDRIQISALSDSKRKPIVRFMHNPAIAEYRKHFNPLYEIIQEQKPIELTYRRFNSKEERTYVVHPYELKEFACRWYLVGSVDHHPGSISCFGFERIISYKTSDVPFRENTRDLDEYFDSMLGLTLNDDKEPQDVLLWVENSEYPYLETNPIHKSQMLVREENGGKVISLHLYVNYELVMRLFSYNEGVKVLAPVELQQKMKEKAYKLAHSYDL